jgi:hypothetical protein
MAEIIIVVAGIILFWGTTQKLVRKADMFIDLADGEIKTIEKKQHLRLKRLDKEMAKEAESLGVEL